MDIEPPRADEILVRVTAAGICHTDLTTRSMWPEQLTPMVLGHEGTGVVEAVGADVTTIAPGDTVCLSFRSCGACPSCADGHPGYCAAFQGLNVSGGRGDGTSPLSRDGSSVFGGFFGQSSFATYAIAYESNTVKVPADLPPEVAAPLGCSVQTGAGAVRNVLRPEPGTSLVVFGTGAVGMSAIMASVALGCSPVVAVDPVASRRALAGELGAKATVDPSAVEDVAATIREATGGGAHFAVDTTAVPAVINQAIGALRPMGSLALAGIGAPEAALDVMSVIGKGLTVSGVIEGDARPADFLPWLIDRYREGKLPVDRLVTSYPFTEIETAAQAALSRQAIKPVVTFG
ncbi:NAD(P)-dependent alcohol dehydrogenase [Streptomyces capitiformicae]|uniref:NAD(P)-dependent alcohol dehydrogenase n=1 Tax=Streptomyces capitiformicae TaxID=2014920 RepID=UPI001E61429A|nr:NAD(P)-dependent alcohol dehydrogenase [Streptomyces capitiformicae]